MSIRSKFPSIRPSLRLTFGNMGRLDPRITFTRSTSATYYDHKGRLRYAAAGEPRFDHNPATLESKGLLIEGARTNLLTYSEQFDNAYWGKARLSISADATTAPDGTLTADKLVEDTTASITHAVYAPSYAATNTTLTATVYAKAGERERFVLSISNFVNSSGFAIFDVFTGTIVSVSGPGIDYTNASALITPVGDGWYRCSITATKGSFNTNNHWIIELNDGTTNAYTGDGTSGLYIWGAQLEAGAFPTSYQPSTETFTSRSTTATYYDSTGTLQTAAIDVERLTYNPADLTAPPSQLFEGSRTNLLTYSEQFDNAAWLKQATASVTANTSTAPDGTTTADTLNFPASLDIINHAVVSASGSTAYLFTVWMSGSGTINLSINTNGGTFKTVTTQITLTSTLTRYELGITTNADNTGLFAIIGRYDGAIGAGTATSVVAWGAQLEAGSYPTSYIPTTTASVTRAADVYSSAATSRAAESAVMTGTNFSEWFRADEGTLIASILQESNRNYSGTFRHVAAITPTSTNDSYIAILIDLFNRPQLDVRDLGTNVVDISSGTNTSSELTFGVAYKVNDFAISTDGLAASTSSSGPAPTTLPLVQMKIGGTRDGTSLGQLNGHIKSLTYYPARLTNAQLQALTS